MTEIARRDERLAHIEKQIKRFENALKPEWQTVWQEGVRLMNFGERPTQTFHYVGGQTGSGVFTWL